MDSLTVGSKGQKPIIGILGGIASGKSTVAGEFAKLGCEVIDADKIAHELLDEPGVKDRVLGVFGDYVLDEAGRIDRRRLAEAAFSDGERLSALNKITHPPVLRRIEELVGQYERQKHVKAIVLDMPLLLEVGWAKRCDRLVFVHCDLRTRLDRAKKAAFFAESQLELRENLQISLDKKMRLADNIVDNNSDFSALVRQVVDIFTCIVDNG